MQKPKTHTSKRLRKVLFFFLIIALARLLVIDLYYVPTASMEPTIKAKSYIWVSKLSFGAKLPKHTYQIPFISPLLKLFHIKKVPLWNDTKLPAIEPIERFDIALVELQNKKIVKRVVGLPHDKISIVNGYLYVNDKALDMTPITLLKSFIVTANDKEKLRTLKADNSSSEWRYIARNSFEVKAPSIFFDEIKKDSAIVISMPPFPVGMTKDNGIFPKCKEGEWSRNNYGSFLIPNKGMELQLNEENYCIYEQIIQEYENVDIRAKNGIFYIDNKVSSYYTFKNDYFFFMGDNRMESIDSRFLGVFPKRNILGKILWK